MLASKCETQHIAISLDEHLCVAVSDRFAEIRITPLTLDDVRQEFAMQSQRLYWRGG